MPAERASAAKCTTRTALLALTFATTLLVGCNDKKSAGTNPGAVPTDQSGEQEGDDNQGAGMMGRREGRDDGATDSMPRGGDDHRKMGMGRQHKGM